MCSRTRLCTLLVLALLVLLAAASVCVGTFPLSLGQICTLLGGGLRDTMEARIFFTLRLPRTGAAVLAGLALGVAGGVYQTIMGGAFVCGMASLAAVLALVRAARADRTATYVLAGILVSALAEAGVMLLKTLADPERELAAIEYWTMGSLSAITLAKLTVMAPPVLVGLVLVLLFRRQVALLSLGEESARASGLEPGRWRVLLLALTTLMVAAVVSVAGVISFVGLIAPHIAYRLLRRRGGAFLPLCALVAADLMLAADLLARSAGQGAELPLSIFTVLFAAPVLAALLVGGRGQEDAA